MDLLHDFQWSSPQPDLRLVRHVKGSPTSGRQVYQVSAGSAIYAMKVHRLGSLRKAWRARRGASLLHNELGMLRSAVAAGLPVPAPVARGERRVAGWITHEALLMNWIDGRRSLREVVTDAVTSHDQIALDRAIELLIAMLVRIRNAGIADRDYAFGQLLVDPAAPDMTPVWLDLEAAFLSAPDDSAGTGASAGMALAGVWNATGGNETALRHAWDLIHRTLPAPVGGWDPAGPAVTLVNTALQFGVEKGMRRGRTHAMPPTLD